MSKHFSLLRIRNKMKVSRRKCKYASPGSTDKGAKNKGCPVTCQASIGFIALGGQQHAPTSSSPGRRHGTYVQEAWWALSSVWAGSENVAPTKVRAPVLLCRLSILVTRRLRLPKFLDNQHMKVVSLLALRTGRLYLPGDIHGTDFCQRPSRLQGHSATGRSKSMKKPNDPIWNRTRDLPAYSAVPQPTDLPGTSVNNNA
jgi:hypothetical protein